MKEKKKILAVVITIIALLLVAAALATILVIKTKNELEDRWEARYEEEEEDEDENEEEPIEQAPAEEAPETEGPAVREEDAGRMALVIMHDPLFADMVADRFAEHCGNLGYAPDIWVVTSNDPAEVVNISMELIASGVDALAVSCWDTDCLREINDVAQASGVLFANLETPYTEENAAVDCLTVRAYSRPLDQAPFVFGFMQQHLGDTGNFGVVKCGENDPVYDALAMIYPGMEGMEELWWSAEVYTDGSVDTNREVLYLLLEENDLDAIICTDADVSRLAVQMIEELGMDIYVYGFAPPGYVLGHNYQGLMFYHDPVALAECLVYTIDWALRGQPMEDGTPMTVPSGDTYYLWGNDGNCTISVPGLVYSDKNLEELAMIYG